jgi:hypothetical protein
MGWSCSGLANDVVQAWTRACLVSTDMQNTYRSRGRRYFWEISRVEHDDGAITGTVFAILSDGTARRSASFRIGGDGAIVRAPAWLRDVIVPACTHCGRPANESHLCADARSGSACCTAPCEACTKAMRANSRAFGGAS